MPDLSTLIERAISRSGERSTVLVRRSYDAPHGRPVVRLHGTRPPGPLARKHHRRPCGPVARSGSR